MNRKENIKRAIDKQILWDIVVIGGGSSGLGVALDGLSRGLKVLLLEKADFAKGTSSRSTKLIHGGFRYLAQGDILLVLEALKERGIILKNAPHLVHKQAFIIPVYSFFDRMKYILGLKIYDLMAGRLGIEKSQFISKKNIIQRMPNIRQDKLKGGVIYYDGQFDDARLALNVAQTCNELGGVMLNYMKVTHLNKNSKGEIDGVHVKDQFSTKAFEVKTKMLVNATGVFADKILKMDHPETPKMIQPSQGIHLVMDSSFLSQKDALLIPKTSDGRVLFAIPWYNKLVVGTTDTLRKKTKLEPDILQKEIDFILKTVGKYLTKAPSRKDVLSAYAGLRPLAAPKNEDEKTREISRSHKIIISKSNLVTLTGGKWTTFRKMGEDTVDYYKQITGETPEKSKSAKQYIFGYSLTKKHDYLDIYGSERKNIDKLIYENPELSEKLHPEFPYIKAEVVWAVRTEMAIKLEDVLARRIRVLFLDARAAISMIPQTARIMAKELDKDQSWIDKESAEFKKLAQRYIVKV
jgi:glycerol-3-phosphate dehydrogenase